MIWTVSWAPVFTAMRLWFLGVTAEYSEWVSAPFQSCSSCWMLAVTDGFLDPWPCVATNRLFCQLIAWSPFIPVSHSWISAHSHLLSTSSSSSWVHHHHLPQARNTRSVGPQSYHQPAGMMSGSELFRLIVVVSLRGKLTLKTEKAIGNVAYVSRLVLCLAYISSSPQF